MQEAFVRLDTLIREIGPILYISLTHHGENRFGGGNKADAGLKDDGEALLDYIDGKHIAIDLSHTSDALAHGIVNHIDRKEQHFKRCVYRFRGEKLFAERFLQGSPPLR